MTTCSELLYVELGVSSIRTLLLIKQWKFWKKVSELSDGEPLAYIVSLSKRLKLKEVKHYETLINKYTNVDEIVSAFNDNVKSSIRNKSEKGRSKYSTYITINPNLEAPSVYTSIRGHKNASMVAKLRTSSHNLQIEMGRRTSTPRENRKCYCGDVEDEKHFLTQCTMYEHIRRKHHVTTKNISTILEDNKYLQYIQDLYDARKDLTTCTGVSNATFAATKEI